MDNDQFGIHKFRIKDKHDKYRTVFNAKVNIYRGQAEPIYLGLQTSDLGNFSSTGKEFVDPDLN